MDGVIPKPSDQAGHGDNPVDVCPPTGESLFQVMNCLKQFCRFLSSVERNIPVSAECLPMERNILVLLFEQPTEIWTTPRLAEHFFTSRQSILKNITSLASQHLIVFQENPRYKSSKRIVLNDEGKAKAKKMINAEKIFYASIASNITAFDQVRYIAEAIVQLETAIKNRPKPRIQKKFKREILADKESPVSPQPQDKI